MNKYGWEELSVATVGNNPRPTPSVLLVRGPSLGEGTKGQLGESVVILYDFTSQVRRIAKEHLFP